MKTLNDETVPVTAGDLARKLGRSSYGVKKALMRLRIEPTAVLGGTSYYDEESAMELLKKEMRSPNQNLAR
jgi:hypothetical protein